MVFSIMAMAPGGVGASLLTRGGDLRPEERAAMQAYINERYGLDKPLPQQYLRWLNNVSPLGFEKDSNSESYFGFKTPDLGMSFAKNRPVTELISDALPITLLLNLLSVPFIYTFSIILGVYSARYRGSVFDIGVGTTNLALYSLPVIWVGTLCIVFLSSKEYLDWFPTSGLHSLESDTWTFLPSVGGDGLERGYLLDMLWHLFLPLLCLSYSSLAFLSKLTRTSVLENLQSDYARTARAKGASEASVLWNHVFRNSLLPLITITAGIIPGLLVGSVVVETIFSIDGMGRLVVDSVMVRDREVVLSITLITSILTLISYLIVDICYAIADPRVSYE